MARNAQVNIYRRGDSWQVYYAGTKSQYTKARLTESEALRDKELLMRRIAGVWHRKGPDAVQGIIPASLGYCASSWSLQEP